MIPDMKKFNQYYTWFMKQFDIPKHHFDASWKLGSDLQDLEKQFFFLNVDYDDDIGQAAVQGADPYPHPIETKLDKLVFEVKLESTSQIEDSDGFKLNRQFEYFDMTFDFQQNYQSTEKLHLALAQAVKRRKLC